MPAPDSAGIPPPVLTPEQLEAWKADARATLEDLRKKWDQFADDAVSCIRRHPGKSALAGLGIGIAAGLIMRR